MYINLKKVTSRKYIKKHKSKDILIYKLIKKEYINFLKYVRVIGEPYLSEIYEC